MLHIPPTNYLSPSCKTRSIPKSLSVNPEYGRILWREKKKSGEWACRQKKKKRSDRKSSESRQKNKTANCKVESNDSPEIPDRGGREKTNEEFGERDSVLKTFPNPARLARKSPSPWRD